jgi:hypothetical protein
MLEMPPSPPTRPSRTILTRWLQGTTFRSQTWRSRKLKTTTLKTNIITTKNTHAESKRIAVKVSRNKHNEKFVVNSKSKKIAVKVFI